MAKLKIQFGILWASTLAAAAAAGPVHISTENSRGSGFAFRNGSQCVILTAGHVVRDASGAIEIKGDNAAVSVDASRFRIPSGADVASVTLPVSEFVSCIEPYRPLANIQSSAAPSIQFRMSVREANGNERVVPLAYAGALAPILRFRPTTKRMGANRGDSGSVVFAGDRAVAIAIEVDPVDGVVSAFPVSQAETILGFNTMVARLPLLAVLKERGRDRPEWQNLLIAGLQDHQRVELGRRVAQADQCFAVFDVKQINVRITNNPQLAEWRRNCKSGSGTIGNLLGCVTRGAEPLPSIAEVGIVIDVLMQKGNGSLRVTPVQFNDRVSTATQDRQAFTESYIRGAIPVALDRAIGEGGCR